MMGTMMTIKMAFTVCGESGNEPLAVVSKVTLNSEGNLSIFFLPASDPAEFQ